MNNQAFISKRKKDVNDFLSIIGNLAISYGSVNFKNHLSNEFWGYTISDIKFNVDQSSLKHIRPSGFTNVEIIIELDVESKISEWEKLNDPFCSLNFRSLIRGTNSKTGKLHYLAFHIDRHNGAETNEIHPLYHLQYLQNNKIKAKDEFDHGETLQLDLPRMMHLPMELILGVSTILSNFSPSTYSKLIQNRQFVNLCKDYQQKIWRPYFNSIENYWLKNPAEWDPKLNCPYLV
ncbi:MAG: hypothetical protein ACJAV5_002117 [Vicingaceae bacterium]|jgi:hypothetical protein